MPIKRLGFENLIQYASMGKDTNEDGVVDGWVAVHDPNTTDSFLFDDTNQAQMINVAGATDAAAPAVETADFLPVTAGSEYTFSVYLMAEGGVSTDTGAQLEIAWYDPSQVFLSSSQSAIFTDSTFTRQFLTAAAPANAAYAKVRVVFRCGDASAYGIVRAKWAQFQEGDTATEYEETDFFELINPAADGQTEYTYGWEKTTTRKYDGLYSLKPVDIGQNPGVAVRVKIPPNAENVEFRFWAYAAEMMANDRMTIWDGGSGIATLNPGGAGFSPWVPLRRGVVFLMFILQRATAGQGTVFLDALEFRWEEVEGSPQPDPPLADRVYSINFESDDYDPFFRIKETAAGYNYGFTRKYDRRYSGLYSFGVADTDVPVSYPEDGSPPTIPYGEKAACEISFRVPIGVMNPALRVYALFDGDPGRDTGRIFINQEEVWSTNQANGWEQLDFSLVPGVEYTVIVEYEKAAGPPTRGTDSIYIDDIFVYYNTPKKPYMYVAAAPQTEIKIGAGETFSIKADFEADMIDSFFTVQNPSRLKSGGGKSEYPEAGWIRTNQIAYQGSYSFRAQREKTKNNEDAAVDFIIKVPHGVKNARVEWWNFVELERSSRPPTGAKYLRLFEEYRIWVNNSIWREFRYCSPDLTKSIHYVGPDGPSGNPANDYACPWGRWWKESLSLSPGQTYTLTFELQRDSGDSSPIHGRDLCAIDNLTISWEETPGEVIITPPEPLVYLDGRDGIAYVDERSGVEMAPLSFAEYPVFGVPGAVHQHTIIEPRAIDFPVVIHGEDRMDVRRKIRELMQKLANKPLTLINVNPEDGVRMIDCWFEGVEGADTETAAYWQRRVLSFRCFDPYWYGEWITVDGADPDNPGENSTEILVSNPGEAEAWPILKLYGPAGNPHVYIAEPGGATIGEFKLTGFTIPENRYVVVDCRPTKKAVFLDDGQSLFQYLDPTSRLFPIPPGEYNVNLDSDSMDINKTKLVATFRPPYWGV